ncbi:MAG TPA: CUAEP/CCAEP-tail radical SAM protein [Acidimicrobiales bacterium]|nr:CUAEP/CCAEP-tail radical SAM protein [Acidimicrobiales bacterium]
MRVLLLSTYELGHQPLGLATAAGALRLAGHEVRAVDLGLDALQPDDLRWADAAAVSVPMHTATRLARDVLAAIGQERPDLAVCAYGLYAAAAAGDGAFDLAVAGEYEAELAAWVDELERSGAQRRPSSVPVKVDLGRRRMPPADRSGLAPLDRYARLLLGSEERLVGYTEASRGCAHRCRHCPVPVVYDGRTRMVDPVQVARDVAGLVAAGAQHITFGDPDFLNGPHHALRVVRQLAEDHPGLTFDITAKVEHVLRHRHLWPELARCGLLFIVSAFESVNESVLDRLAKNHTAAEAAEAVWLLRSNGIEVRPSWLPFTPWTEMDDLTDLVDFVIDNDLVDNVDPVQYAIRLLVPPGSLLLEDPDAQTIFGPYDAALLGHPWSSREPALDDLAAAVAAVAETSADSDPALGFAAVHEVIDDFARANRQRRPKSPPAPSGRVVPRLSESWFCCAEPTCDQSSRVIALAPSPGAGSRTS